MASQEEDGAFQRKHTQVFEKSWFQMDVGDPQNGKSKKGKSKFWTHPFWIYPFTLGGYMQKRRQDIQNTKRRRGRLARPGSGAGPGPARGAGPGPGGAAPPPLGILCILASFLDIPLKGTRVKG